MAFLFDEIRYEILGVIVDSTKKVGIASTLKGLVSLAPKEKNILAAAGWVAPEKDTITPDSSEIFDFHIPLKLLLGFTEDYRRIVINVNQENEKDVIKARSPSMEATFDWSLTLNKIVLRVPHLRLPDKHRLPLLRS